MTTPTYTGLLVLYLAINFASKPSVIQPQSDGKCPLFIHARARGAADTADAAGECADRAEPPRDSPAGPDVCRGGEFRTGRGEPRDGVEEDCARGEGDPEEEDKRYRSSSSLLADLVETGEEEAGGKRILSGP
ncbi:hypothetical protein GJ744_006567 [Endocarpon pusillum]|uniref:Uncharacterized protein n=1 Tax=Endocarpon pusillum TaxID=364733 RepID=A0A8H7ARC1_9EURO|nr:hypothetical protein GJ744_006567 [Endocarpon pusillum]